MEGPAERRTIDAARPTGTQRWIGGGLTALGVGLATNSLLGPFILDAVEYPLSETLINQTIGLDAFSLVIVAPLSFLAGWLVLRGYVAGSMLAVGLAGYATYMLMQYIVGPAYLTYPAVIPLQLGLFVAAAAIGVAAWASVDATALPAMTPRVSRRYAYLALGLAAFVLSRYIPAFVGTIAGDPIPADALDDPTMHWLIVMLDLGVVVPATVAAAFGLLRGAVWAPKALYAIVGWFALVPPSVAAMALVMLARDDPHANVGQTAVFTIAAFVFLVFVAWVYRPLLGTSGSKPFAGRGGPVSADSERAA
jgi:hypothetical protein